MYKKTILLTIIFNTLFAGPAASTLKRHPYASAAGAIIATVWLSAIMIDRNMRAQWYRPEKHVITIDLNKKHYHDHEIIEILREQIEIPGKYFYDVRSMITTLHSGGNGFGQVIRTDKRGDFVLHCAKQDRMMTITIVKTPPEY